MDESRKRKVEKKKKQVIEEYTLYVSIYKEFNNKQS